MFGDTVYLRVADYPAEEVAAAIVSQKGTQALLAVPRWFFSMVQVRTPNAPYPVVTWALIYSSKSYYLVACGKQRLPEAWPLEVP